MFYNFFGLCCHKFDDGILLYKELILKIATAKKDKWIYKDSGKDDFNPRDYELWGRLSPITMFYAVNYEELNYTKDENKAIQQYLKIKAMIDRLDRDGNRSRRKLCPITAPMKLNGKKDKIKERKIIMYCVLQKEFQFT